MFVRVACDVLCGVVWCVVCVCVATMCERQLINMFVRVVCALLCGVVWRVCIVLNCGRVWYLACVLCGMYCVTSSLCLCVLLKNVFVCCVWSNERCCRMCCCVLFLFV